MFVIAVREYGIMKDGETTVPFINKVYNLQSNIMLLISQFISWFVGKWYVRGSYVETNGQSLPFITVQNESSLSPRATTISDVTPGPSIASTPQLHPEEPLDINMEELLLERTDSGLAPAWMPFNELEINRSLYEHGIVALRPCLGGFVSGSTDQLDEQHFFIGSNAENKRELSFKTRPKYPNKFSKDALLSITLTQYAQKKIPVDTSLIERDTYEHKKYRSEQQRQEKIDIIVNCNRRSEIFSPFVLHDIGHNENVGFYVYPWLTEDHGISRNFKFSGFTRFVTAGCMFGSILKGIDDKNGAELNLIKHNIKFHSSQKIEKIAFNPKAPNAYEEVLFCELNKLLLFIDKLSEVDQPKQLYYHLPYYDYILFGMELFIRGRMTLSALDKFFQIIMHKRTAHIEKIVQMCTPHGIKSIIESPFENLFGQVADFNGTLIAESIFSALGFSDKESVELKDDDEDQNKQVEERLVRYCLEKLKTNTINLKHQKVWGEACIEEFFKDKDKDQEDICRERTNRYAYTLDNLFKAANAVMIAVACYGELDYKTCSLLPVSEKQIQVGYAEFHKRSRDTHSYPAVFNITTIDPVFAYDHSTKGSLFYFNSCQRPLTDLVTKMDILSQSHRNIAFAAEHEYIDSIDILTELPRCRPS